MGAAAAEIAFSRGQTGYNKKSSVGIPEMKTKMSTAPRITLISVSGQ
jgi:hypothetical protein